MGRKLKMSHRCLAVVFLKSWSHHCLVFPLRDLTWRCLSDSLLLCKWFKYFEALFLQACHAVWQVQIFWDCRKSPHQLRGQKKSMLSPGTFLQSAATIVVQENTSKFTLLDGERIHESIIFRWVQIILSCSDEIIYFSTGQIQARISHIF